MEETDREDGENVAEGRRVIVTGGSGKAGRYVVADLRAHGHEVLNLDLRPPTDPSVETLLVDLTDAGQVFNAFASTMVSDFDTDSPRPQPVDAIVHLAAIPSMLIVPDNEIFRINALSTYNVLDAASKLKIPKVVIGSSESAYGFVFSFFERDPAYLPLDEEHPLDPMDSYALSKVVNERTARAFFLRTGMDVYVFRIGNIIEPHEYADLIASFSDPAGRRRIVWSYIDARDLAQACRLGVETDGLGFEVFNIANDEVSSDQPVGDLLKTFYPNVPLSRDLGEHETLLSNGRAKEMLGFKPEHTWMEHQVR